MARPTLTVEIAFENDPLGTPTWTDVTSYTRQVSIKRGKSSLFDKMRAGTCSVVLSNKDGRFDPNNTLSPYAPYVLPMRQIRVRATHSATTYGLFRGYLESVPLTYPANAKDSVATVTAVDGFKILNLRAVTTTESEELSGTRVTNILDAALWPAGLRSIDAGQTTVQGNASVVWHTADDQTASFSGTTVIDLQKPLNITAGDLLVAVITSDVSNSSTSIWPTIPSDWTEVVQSHDTASATDPAVAVYWKIAGGSEPAYYRWSGGASGEHRGLIGRVTGHAEDDPIPVTVVNRTASSVNSLQLDAFTATRDGLLVGAWAWKSAGTVTLPGTMSSLHSNASAPGSAWGQESVSAGAVGTRTATFSASSAVAAAEVFIIAATTLDNANPLTHLLTVADSELGLFFMDRDGNARFISRHGLIGGVLDTTNYTFGGKPYRGGVFAFDDHDLWNEVKVSSPGVAEQTASDTGSQTTYGKRTLTKSLLLTSTTEQMNHATFVLTGTKAPALRVEQMEPVPDAVGGNWPRVLDRELGSKILVTLDPPGSGDTISQGSYIEGISWSISPQDWRCVWDLVPIDRRADYWVLGDSIQGVLGDTTRLAY